MTGNKTTGGLPPEITESALEHDRKTAEILETMESFSIDSDSGYESAAAELLDIKDRSKAIDAERQKIKKPALETCRRVDAFFKIPLDRLKRAEGIIKSAMSTYHQAQERKRIAAKRKAEEDAARERDRREKERREREAKEKAEADQRETEALQRAEELAADGKQAEADQVLRDAELAPRHNVPPEPDPIPDIAVPAVAEKQKTDGISHRTTWKARVVDPRALMKAIIEGKAPSSLFVVDQKKLNQIARGMGEDMNYPGVEVYPEATVAAGRR